jgi:hypothetical protein
MRRSLSFLAQGRRTPRPSCTPMTLRFVRHWSANSSMTDGISSLMHSRWPKGAAPDILDAMSGSGADAVSLEAYLRTQYRHSDDPYDQRRWYSIVAYLQRLLLWVSIPDTRGGGTGIGPRPWSVRYQPDRLTRVVNMALDNWDHVCFITLNYDLILDRYLATLDALETLPHFIAHPRWSLIKLHGSVAWQYRLTQSLSLENPPANLDDFIERDQIFHNPNFSNAQQNAVVLDTGTYPGFPALSAPLGERMNWFAPTNTWRSCEGSCKASRDWTCWSATVHTTKRYLSPDRA